MKRGWSEPVGDQVFGSRKRSRRWGHGISLDPGPTISDASAPGASASNFLGHTKRGGGTDPKWAWGNLRVV